MTLDKGHRPMSQIVTSYIVKIMYFQKTMVKLLFLYMCHSLLQFKQIFHLDFTSNGQLLQRHRSAHHEYFKKQEVSKAALKYFVFSLFGII